MIFAPSDDLTTVLTTVSGSGNPANILDSICASSRPTACKLKSVSTL